MVYLCFSTVKTKYSTFNPIVTTAPNTVTEFDRSKNPLLHLFIRVNGSRIIALMTYLKS